MSLTTRIFLFFCLVGVVISTQFHLKPNVVGNWTQIENWMENTGGVLNDATRFPIVSDVVFFDQSGSSSIIADMRTVLPICHFVTGTVNISFGSPTETPRGAFNYSIADLNDNITFTALHAYGNGTYFVVSDLIKVITDFFVYDTAVFRSYSAQFEVKGKASLFGQAKVDILVESLATLTQVTMMDQAQTTITSVNTAFPGLNLFKGNAIFHCNTSVLLTLEGETHFSENFTMQYVRQFPSTLLMHEVVFENKVPLFLGAKSSLTARSLIHFAPGSVVTLFSGVYTSFDGPVLLNGTFTNITSNSFFIFREALQLLSEFNFQSSGKIELRGSVRFSGNALIDDDFLGRILFLGSFIFEGNCRVVIKRPYTMDFPWNFYENSSLLVDSALNVKSALLFESIGGMSGDGRITWDGTFNGKVPVGSPTFLNVHMTVNSDLFINQGYFIFGKDLYMNVSSSVTIKGNCTMHIDGAMLTDRTLIFGTGNMTISQTGSITIPSQASMVLPLPILNMGTIDISGLVKFPAKFVQTATGKIFLRQSTLNVADGAPLIINGLLSGSGTVNAAFSNIGMTRVSARSILTISGDANFPYPSTIALESNGFLPEQNSMLVVNGVPNLNSLVYVKLSRFSVLAGAQIPFLTYTGSPASARFNTTTVLGGAPYKRGKIHGLIQRAALIEVQFFIGGSNSATLSVFLALFTLIVFTLL